MANATPPAVVLPTETPAAPTPTDSADFDSAFATFSAGDTPPADSPEPPAGGEPAPTPPADSPEPPAGGEPAPTPPADSPEPPASGAKPAAESDEALLARLAALVGKNQPPAEPAAPQAPAAQPDAPALFTPDETKFLETYEQEWSEVSRGEALKRRAETRALVEYMFTEVANELRPLAQGYQELMAAARLGTIQSKVPAYETVKAEVAKWAESQPAYLRSAYQNVLQSGNADDIADLVARYTKEAGKSPAPAPVAKPATELPPPARQAAMALAPVSSKRSAVVSADIDRNDFDGAFAKFAASGN